MKRKGRKRGKKIKECDRQEMEREKMRMRKLERNVFCLWEYICTEGLAEEAREYLLENGDSRLLLGLE